MKKNRDQNRSELRRKAEQAIRNRARKLPKAVHRDEKRLLHELETHRIELEMQNEELRRARQELEESQRRYAYLYEFAPVGYFVLDRDGVIRSVNVTGSGMLGHKKQNTIGRPFAVFLFKEDQPRFSEHLQQVYHVEVKQIVELRMLRPDRSTVHVQLQSIASAVEDGLPSTCLAAVIDITERKRAEDILKRFSKELQTKFEEKKKDLEETDTALKVLLRQREKDREELEERVAANVHDLVLPCIEHLRKDGTGQKQESHLDLLESGLSSIISPFLARLSSKNPNLTGTEIQVINYIKAGKSTKQIAGALCISTGTVDFHRNNIRTKLGLRRTKTNLRTYLLSLK